LKQIKTILFPTDFSKSANFAWKLAILHAERHRAKIVLLHVIHRMPQDYQWMIVAMTPAEIYETLKKQAMKKMARMVTEANARKIKTATLIRDGVPFAEIIACAKELKADMIIMGSHGRTALEQMLVGSVAEKVVRKAPCSVLVVKHPKQVFRMP
jgi:nucleotide-binding universal stress UspA family protein